MHADKRIEYLADPGSFSYFKEPGTSAFITGIGAIGGHPVVICATETRLHQNVDIIDGISDYINALNTAGDRSLPFILLLDSGPRSDSSKQLESLNPEQLFLGPGGMGDLFYKQARLAGQVPRLGVVLGPVAASRSFMISLCDCVAFVRGTGISMASPAMIKQLTGETTDFWQLGGADIHFSRTGMADVLTVTEEDALNWVRRAVLLLAEPKGSSEIKPAGDDGEMQMAALYSMPAIRQIMKYITDEDSLLELKSGYRMECVTALARIEGQVVGIIANNPQEGGGAIYPESCEKMLHFLDICDAFGIPLLFLVDTPGFIMGREAEWKGIIKTGGALFTRLARLRCRRAVIVVNKAFSTGLYAMAGAGFGPESFAALPGASILFYGDRLLEFYLETPFISEDERAALTDMLQTAGDPGQLVERGRLGQVIELRELRSHAAAFLRSAPASPAASADSERKTVSTEKTARAPGKPGALLKKGQKSADSNHGHNGRQHDQDQKG